MKQQIQRRGNKLSPIEEFLALKNVEKESIAGKFDQEFVADTFRPLNTTERKQWQRIKRKLGRPTKGQGHKVISVSLEKGLLKRADVFAKRAGMTRAALIAQGIEFAMSRKERSWAA